MTKRRQSDAVLSLKRHRDAAECCSGWDALTCQHGGDPDGTDLTGIADADGPDVPERRAALSIAPRRTLELDFVTDAFQALTNPGRIEILRALLRSEPDGVTADALRERMGKQTNTLPGHMAILSRAGLARAVRSETTVVYRPCLDSLRAVLGFLGADCCHGQPELCLSDAVLMVPGRRPSCRCSQPRSN